MATQNNSPWPIRLSAAEKMYENWSTLFKCDILETYYEGFQWKQRKDYNIANYNPYMVNLFYSTIKIKLANFLFKRPQFVISPRPGNSDWDIDFAVKSATLKQDTLNTIIQNININFTKHLKLAALDSFFRFGLVEIGYAADWRNPSKEDPYLTSWDDTNIQPEQDKRIDDNEVPEREWFYAKRIRPRRFRVSAGEATDLKDFDWCGYYDFAYTNMLKKTKGIKWPKNAPDTTLYDADYAGIMTNTQLDSDIRNNMEYNSAVSKVWHIFDNVKKVRCLYLDEYWNEPLWEGSNYRLPLIDLRWDFRTEGFYPLPPCFQWLMPQDEINEAREQTRSYRRRFTRRFQVLQDNIDEEEKEKFAAGPDGILITVKKENAITPIENPQLGQTVDTALLLAKDDFITVSGSSAEVVKSDRETATKSAIEDQRTKIRESAEQIDFSDFVCLIGREILCQASEKMSMGMWIKLSGDPHQPGDTQGILKDMQANLFPAQYITNQDITDGYDYEIEIDVINGTPAAMAAQMTAYVTFLSLLQKFPMIALSPILIRKTAYVCGYRDEQVIQQMQQAALLSMAAKAAQQSAKSGGLTLSEAANQRQESSTPGETRAAQMETPGVDKIETQLNQQLDGSTTVM